MFVFPDFDPIALQLGPLAIRWYGLMYLLAFGLFLWLGKQQAKAEPRWGIAPSQVDDLLFYGVIGVVLGGRLGYILFYKPGEYLADPLSVFYVWQGGMAFHGGLVGVLVATWLYARSIGMRWLQLTDFIAPLIPLGLAAGGELEVLVEDQPRLRATLGRKDEHLALRITSTERPKREA